MSSISISRLLNQLSTPQLEATDVIPWACPVPYFGDISTASIATVGINPSNREFVDSNGLELTSIDRRFPTLQSTGLNNWLEATSEHLHAMQEAYINYFFGNPYDSWFRRLDYLLSGTHASYYFPSMQACHLDVVPYATATKWALLSTSQKANLLSSSSDIIGELLKNSPIKLLVLNGSTVVQLFKTVSDVSFTRIKQEKWSLPRKRDNVDGYSYEGYIKKFGNIELTHPISVIGFNHNIQSSFGVTSQVQIEIRNWITEKSNQIFL